MFRTINFEILMFSSSLFTLYIIGLLLWIKVLSVWYRSDGYGQPIRWLWPRQSAYQAYNRLALFHIVLSILGILCMVWVDWEWGTVHQYAFLGVLLPVLGLWLTVRTLWKSTGKGLMQAEESHTDLRLLDSSRLLTAYARFGIGSFVLLGVLPAVLFFKLAHDEEMRLFVQQQMWGLAESLEHHTHAIWRKIGTGDNRENFQYVTNNRPCLIPGCQEEIQATHTKSTPCVSSGMSTCYSRPPIHCSRFVFESFLSCLSLIRIRPKYVRFAIRHILVTQASPVGSKKFFAESDESGKLGIHLSPRIKRLNHNGSGGLNVIISPLIFCFHNSLQSFFPIKRIVCLNYSPPLLSFPGTSAVS